MIDVTTSVHTRNMENLIQMCAQAYRIFFGENKSNWLNIEISEKKEAMLFGKNRREIFVDIIIIIS